MAEGGTVWLVGMMGVGKSTIGPALARALERPFVDTDAEVEQRAGRSVAEIFADEGEAAFRRRERARIRAWAGRPAVVALGGGAIAQPGAAGRLAASGTVVYLRAAPETLLSRLGDCRRRPLLHDLAPAARRARLEALLAERREAYESASIAVDTDETGPDELASDLARRVREVERT